MVSADTNRGSSSSY